MSFNPDISKHDKNIVFSGKSHKFTDPPVFSNKSPVVQSEIHCCSSRGETKL